MVCHQAPRTIGSLKQKGRYGLKVSNVNNKQAADFLENIMFYTHQLRKLLDFKIIHFYKLKLTDVGGLYCN